MLRSLAEGEVLSAITALNELSARAWEKKDACGDLAGGPEAFLHLLRRRGYFVSTFEEVAQTVQEIAAMGEGFDLYALARALAEFDVTVTRCLGLRKEPLFPELERFLAICPCGGHGRLAR